MDKIIQIKKEKAQRKNPIRFSLSTAKSNLLFVQSFVQQKKKISDIECDYYLNFLQWNEWMSEIKETEHTCDVWEKHVNIKWNDWGIARDFFFLLFPPPCLKREIQLNFIKKMFVSIWTLIIHYPIKLKSNKWFGSLSFFLFHSRKMINALIVTFHIWKINRLNETSTIFVIWDLFRFYSPFFLGIDCCTAQIGTSTCCGGCRTNTSCHWSHWTIC